MEKDIISSSLAYLKSEICDKILNSIDSATSQFRHVALMSWMSVGSVTANTDAQDIIRVLSYAGDHSVVEYKGVKFRIFQDILGTGETVWTVAVAEDSLQVSELNNLINKSQG